MVSSKLAKVTLLFAFVLQICAFDFFRREYGDQPVGHSDSEVERLQHTYKVQVESLKLTEATIQKVSDEALEILPEWLGTLEARDSAQPITREDVKEFCTELKPKLRSPASCQPFLTRKLKHERDDINHLWQTRKSDLQSMQQKYRTLRLDIAKTVKQLQKLGAEISN